MFGVCQERTRQHPRLLVKSTSIWETRPLLPKQNYDGSLEEATGTRGRSGSQPLGICLPSCYPSRMLEPWPRPESQPGPSPLPPGRPTQAAHGEEQVGDSLWPSAALSLLAGGSSRGQGETVPSPVDMTCSEEGEWSRGCRCVRVRDAGLQASCWADGHPAPPRVSWAGGQAGGRARTGTQAWAPATSPPWGCAPLVRTHRHLEN